MEVERIHNPADIIENDIRDKIANCKELIIQFSSEMYNEAVLTKLNNLCRQYDKRLGVRFFTYGKECFDCLNLRYIPDVKNLYISCGYVKNIEELSKLTDIKKLFFGVEDYNEENILHYQNLHNIENLILGECRLKFDLKLLKNFNHLSELGVVGNLKNIEEISCVENLSELYLRKIKVKDISFLNSMKKLTKIDILLGSIETIDKLLVDSLLYLQLCRVRGLSNIGDISRFQKIQYLCIEDQTQLEKINILSEQKEMKRLLLLNCKNLVELRGLEKLKGLIDLRLFKTSMEFQKFYQVKFPQSLETIYFGVGKKKEDEIYVRKLKELGYETFSNNINKGINAT